MQEYNPVQFFPPALQGPVRMNMDFRPLPADAPVAETDAPDPKGSSVPESAPYLVNDPSQLSIAFEPPSPVTTAIAAKDSGKPKVSAPSTQVS